MDTDLTKMIQQKEFELLNEIVKAFDAMNIDYYLAYGTLLGAVRHNGFIPWDDDVDLRLKREDYEKFLAEGQKYLPKNYFIQHYTTEEKNNNIFIKVRDTNTIFLENDNNDLDINHGFFVDIFPIDRVPRGLFNGKEEFYRQRIFNFINECYDVPYINSIISPYKRLLAKTIHILFCSIIDRNYLLKREDDRRKKNDIKGYDDYLVGFFGYSGLDCFANLSDIKMFKFEDKYFKGPSNANYILEKLYGDYMSLPPVEQRQTHNPLKVIFDLKQIEE